MRRSSSAANRRRSAGRITSPMRPVAPPITSKGDHTCRGWELNAAATPTSAQQAPTVIIPTNRPSTRPRALPRPPSTPMIAPTTPTRLPIIAPSSVPDRALHHPRCAASAWAIARWRCIGPSQTAPRPGNIRLISKRLGACDAPLMSKGSSNRRQLDSPCSAARRPQPAPTPHGHHRVDLQAAGGLRRAADVEGKLDPPPARLAVQRGPRALRGKRAAEKPLAVGEHCPHLEVALPRYILVANLAGDDVARTRDLRVIDGDEMKGRRARGRGTELERRRGTRSLAGPHHTRGHDRPRPVDRQVLCGHRTGGYQEHYSGASEHASHVDPPAPCDELPGACGTSRR